MHPGERFNIRSNTSQKSLTFKSCIYYTQLTFSCSKVTIETLKKGAKYVQS